jgi:hypothetical protein
MNLKALEKKAIKQVEAWNQEYLEGQNVLLLKDNGDEVETKTKSEAWVMGCCAVALFEGISGAYRLDRAEAIL